MPWDIAGHDAAVRSLQAALISGQIGHAYMFVGPKGIGKGRLALQTAKALMCELDKTQAPCGACRGCRRVESNNHPDLHRVMPEGTGVKIDQMRQLQDTLALRPYEAKYKVVIIDDADSLTVQAQNSMLKSFEEPSGDTVYILIVHNPDALLPTIHSRCQIIRLQPVADEVVAALLQKERGMDMDQATLLAALSDGRPGLALTLDAEQMLAQRKRVVEWCGALRQDGLKAVIRIGDTLEKDADLSESLTALSVWLRDLWHYNVDPHLQLVNRDMRDTIAQEAPFWRSGAVHALSAVAEAKNQLARNVNRRLVLDYMLIRIQRGLTL
ncbi:MAG TPA: DNA polymerase III subunit delta' [Firmicutes bacterium]|nr:DNA polymerase III subunit delta' [Bacillota bacterium]